MDDGGPSGAGYGKNRGKRKADDKFEGRKRERSESKISFYTDLTEIPKRIYLDIRGQILYEGQLRANPRIRRGLENFVCSMSWMEMK